MPLTLATLTLFTFLFCMSAIVVAAIYTRRRQREQTIQRRPPRRPS
jgi:hypothetical protein